MRVFVTGGSGFVGGALCGHLMDLGHGVTVLSRSQRGAAALPEGVEACIGDPTAPGDWQERAAACDGFVNLAGASIFGRWSAEYKALIESSRVETTRNLVDAIGRREGDGPAVLVSASAVGYYGFAGDEKLNEASPPGDDFLARVCRRWEAEAQRAEEHGTRVVLARLGIVMDLGGGALAQMLPIFKLGLGGPLGSGRQWLSWVHRADLAAALAFCLSENGLSGPVNCTAPEPVRNRELTRELGRALKRPAFLPVPGLAIKAVMGELGSVLLRGQRVPPTALTGAGFKFSFPSLARALADLFG